MIHGGGPSPDPTRLCQTFPAIREKYRENIEYCALIRRHILQKAHPEQLPTISVECASFPEQGIHRELRRRLTCKLAPNLRSRPLKPGSQLVLTFPSLGTCHSLWRRIDQDMATRGLRGEQQRLGAYVVERPSAEEGRRWLEALRLERIGVTEWPLEVPTDPGPLFPHHPVLRGGFLDDLYECFEDERLADEVMTRVSEDVPSFTP